MLFRLLRPRFVINSLIKPFRISTRRRMEPEKVPQPEVAQPDAPKPTEAPVEHKNKEKKKDKEPKEAKEHKEKKPKEEKKVEEKPHVEVIYINYETDQFGDYPMIQSTYRSGRNWTHVSLLFDVGHQH